MRFFGIIFSLFLISESSNAMRVTFKGDYVRTSTDNVDSTNTSAVKDTYSDVIAAITARNDNLKLRLKYKDEIYKKTTVNNNTVIDTNATWKKTKSNDILFGFTQTKYNSIPLTTSDTSSSNKYYKISSTWTNEITKDKSWYVGLLGGYKDYYTLKRYDPVGDITLGLDNTINSKFSINPEIVLEYNNSNSSYYKNLNLNPSIMANFTLAESFELYLSASYTYTAYNSRTFTQTVNKRTVSTKEHQGLFTSEAGAIFNPWDFVGITLKYTSNRNNSNNSTSAYQSHLYAFDIAIRL